METSWLLLVAVANRNTFVGRIGSVSYYWAGLEIENPHLANAAAAGDLAWVGELTDTRYSDALDDRFVAALDLSGE
jgi:uncharacterized protein YfaS (alpha-2-macroglobulin family)